MAPAILARLWAAEQDGRRLVTVVTAPSHTAVDEAMEDVAEWLKSFHDATGELDDTAFVRVRSGGGDTTPRPNGEYVNYYDGRDVDGVTELLEPHMQEGTGWGEHVVLFTATASLRGIVDKVARAGNRVFDEDGAEGLMAAGESFVDLLAIDEASMLSFPQTLLASAYLRTDTQTLLIGDHRQMEPVQQHDWESEDRRTIEEMVPFMWALNFV